MFVYCLRCHSNQVSAVAARCEQIIGCKAISPTCIRRVKRQHCLVDVPTSLMPGYLYLYSEGEPLPVNQVLKIKGVKEILGQKDTGYLITGDDKDFALMLLKHNGILGKTTVGRSGNKLSLPADTFSPLTAEILRVDRRRSTMQLCFNYGTPPFTIWVEYEPNDEQQAHETKQV